MGKENLMAKEFVYFVGKRCIFLLLSKVCAYILAAFIHIVLIKFVLTKYSWIWALFINKKQPFPVILQNKRANSFAEFTEKHLCRSLFIKVAGLSPGTLLKKRLRYMYFSVNFMKVFSAPFLIENLQATTLDTYYKVILNDTHREKCFWFNSHN